MTTKFIGIDVGSSKISLIGGSEEKPTTEVDTYSTSDYWSEEGILELISRFIENEDVEEESIESIGMCLPGRVDVVEKKMVYSSQTDELEFEEIETRFNVNLEIENDGNAAVLAEKIHNEEDYENILAIMIGSGIGGGLILNNNLVRSGTNGDSPEPGMIYVDKNKTWHDILGGENLPYFTSDFTEDDKIGSMNSEEIFELMDDGGLNELREELVSSSATAIASLINCYGPELVSFGGSVALKNRNFMKDIFEEVRERDLFHPTPELKLSELGDNIGVYGALALARRKN